MRAILSAPGSRGDVNPMVAIGRELKKLGFDVVISLAEPYVDIAKAVGLDAIPVVTEQRFSKLLANPAMWKPIRGIRRIFADVVTPFIDQHFEVIEQAIDPGNTVLVAHPLDLASRLYHDLHPATPLASIHLAPAMLRHDSFPPRLTSWPVPTWPRWFVRSSFAIADHIVVDPLVRPALKPYFSSVGRKTPRRVLNQWCLSPELILAMYPDWFAPELTTEYLNLETVGFPCEDLQGASQHIESDSIELLTRNKPIAFTSGTAHHHSRAFFSAAVSACVELNRPGLLLTSHAENIPPDLPGLVTSCAYVPLEQLLPGCSAIVHHGGIGTTSAAIKAGIPQIIRPMAYDQFDNASRVERLGCGTWLRRDGDLVKTLQGELNRDSKQQQDLIELSQKLRKSPSPSQLAAKRIQELLL